MPTIPNPDALDLRAAELRAEVARLEAERDAERERRQAVEQERDGAEVVLAAKAGELTTELDALYAVIDAWIPPVLRQAVLRVNEARRLYDHNHDVAEARHRAGWARASRYKGDRILSRHRIAAFLPLLYMLAGVQERRPAASQSDDQAVD